ncbi:phenylacetate--CoA ligase family protein [Qaidamihabitans albus]|uniref:phenylacetate--CoA ligase family protein n=1 Tax=Qaidamihabitans albus TaxID=2795733 RepID=UPI0018F14E7A|nr:phenylacetate--CoA ligase family protein [Qaidamihabitans albus]
MAESLWTVLRDLKRVRRGGIEEIAARQRSRLAELVAHARANSPYYRELYHALPERVTDTTTLPITTKAELMDRFGDWVTDRAITLDAVREFIEDDENAGTPFLGSYLVVTTSGTSGERGVFIQDDRMFNVLSAITVGRATGQFLRGRHDYWGMVSNGGRTAALWATGGHFAGYATARRLMLQRPSRRRKIRIISIHHPLERIVAELNEFRPGILNGYASAIALAAREREAGRLNIAPVLVITAAEGLPPEEYPRIAEAFGAKVRNQYACAEFMGLANGCGENWLHVNADWVILEPVDAKFRPVPPGERSHTVLLTNLANRVQPIIRYDLGDSITVRPDPCPCGSPLPAIQVQGRTSDVLVFTAENGREVRLPPLALGTLVDRTPGVSRFQIVQDQPTRLRVRLEPSGDRDDGQVWSAVRGAITDLLAEHGVRDVEVTRDGEPPSRSAGGKFRPVYSELAG